MTAELQAIGRQILEREAQLPQPTGLLQVQNAFNRVSSMFGQKAVEASSQAASLAGQQAALSGNPMKLAPGLTTATKSFNQSFNQVQSSLVSMNIGKQFSDYILELQKPGNLKATSFGDFNNFANSVVKGAIDGVTPENKASVALQLTQKLYNAQDTVARMVNQKTINDLSADYQEFVDTSKSELAETIYKGDLESANIIKENIKDEIDAFKNLDIINSAQAEQQKKQIETLYKKSEWDAKLLNTPDDQRAEFVANFASSKPRDLTFQEWDEVGQQLLNRFGTMQKMQAGQDAYLSAQAMNDIYSGKIQSLDQLAESYSNDMSGLAYLNVENKLLKALKSKTNEAAQIQEFVQKMITSPSEAAAMPEKVKNAAFDNALDIYVNQKREQTQNPNYTPNMLDKAEVLKGFTTNVPKFDKEMSYALTKSPNPLQFAEAMQAYQNLNGALGSGQPLSPALNLDSDAQKVLVTAQNAQEVMTGKNLETAIDQARKSALYADQNLIKRRTDQFDLQVTQPLTSKNSAAKIFKEVFGERAKENPLIYTDFYNQLRFNSQFFDSVDEAVEMTRREMVNNIGKSKYNYDKNKLVKFPPEKIVAFSDAGKWFDNQIELSLDANVQAFEQIPLLKKEKENMVAQLTALTELALTATDANEQKELENQIKDLQRKIRIADYQGPRIERIGPNLNVEYTDDELFSQDVKRQAFLKQIPESQKKVLEQVRPEERAQTEDFLVKKYPSQTLLIDGVQRKVFIIPDDTVMTGQSGRPTYSFFYLDDRGYPTILPDVAGDNYGFQMQAQSLNEFLPNFTKEAQSKSAAELKSKIIDQVTRLEAAKEIKGSAQEVRNRLGFMANFMDPEDRRALASIDNAEKRKDEIAKKVKSILGETNE